MSGRREGRQTGKEERMLGVGGTWGVGGEGGEVRGEKGGGGNTGTAGRSWFPALSSWPGEHVPAAPH